LFPYVLVPTSGPLSASTVSFGMTGSLVLRVAHGQEAESTFSLNFKRGILSAIQNSFDRTNKTILEVTS
jgi:hypothetical protein